MPKYTPPANKLRPDQRYEDDKQLYHFGGAFRTAKVETGQKGWMYTVPEIGISAGRLLINDVGISMDNGGHLYVTAYQIVHKPNVGPFGTIEIIARDETTGEVPY